MRLTAPTPRGTSARHQRETIAWTLFWAHLIAQPVYALLPANLELAGTLFIVFTFTAFSLAHLSVTRGARAAAALAAASLIVAGGLEALSVATGWPFGSYAYSADLGPAVAGVSLLVPACWFMMAYPASRVAEVLTARRAWAFVPVAALALTAWDLFLDPQMIRAGLWTWTNPGAYAGVPLSNYAGWAITGALIFTTYRPHARPGAAPRDAFDALPIVAYVWTWFGSTLVNAAWWHQGVVAAVGGLGMGAFAAPAALLTARAVLKRRARR